MSGNTQKTESKNWRLRRKTKDWYKRKSLVVYSITNDLDRN